MGVQRRQQSPAERGKCTFCREGLRARGPVPGSAVRAAAAAGSSIGDVLEAVYLTLLCLSALAIAWFSVFVVYRLFKGQR